MSKWSSSKPPASPGVPVRVCPDKNENTASMVFPLMTLLGSQYFKFKKFSETDVVYLLGNPSYIYIAVTCLHSS